MGLVVKNVLRAVASDPGTTLNMPSIGTTFGDCRVSHKPFDEGYREGNPI